MSEKKLDLWFGYIAAVLLGATAIFFFVTGNKVLLLLIASQLLLVERWLRIIWGALCWIHTEVRFVKRAKWQRRAYTEFKRRAKAGEVDDFEDEAKRFVR